MENDDVKLANTLISSWEHILNEVKTYNSIDQSNSENLVKKLKTIKDISKKICLFILNNESIIDIVIDNLNKNK